MAVTLKELFKKRKIGLVWGMCGDKDALGFAKALGGTVKRCWCVPIDSERSVEPKTLLQIARTEGWQAEVTSVTLAREQAKAWATDNNGVVCIAGSLFLAGEVLARVSREV